MVGFAPASHNWLSPDVSPRFSAVLLAGGKSSRMQRDKAFIEINGIPLWQRQLCLLQELQPQELFISGPSRAQWESKGATIIQDERRDAGPLAGLTAALRLCSTNLLLALAVDLPHMTAAYLRDLLAPSSELIGCVPRFSDRFEPLAAIYPVASLPLAETCLESGDYSLQGFVAGCISQEFVRPKEISPDEERLFLNLNMPEDLQAVTHG